MCSNKNPTAFNASSLHGSARGGVVDHRLARRALINEYRRGRLRRDQICDAHPELMRAARHIGDETSVLCPICEEGCLVLVTYVFGPHLPAHGRVISQSKEAAQFSRSTDEYAAYVVEACRVCRWHHLLRVLPVGGRQRRAG